MADESALIVPVPAAELFVDPFRRKLDPSKRQGMPAHITLLYPFAPRTRIDQSTIDVLTDVFKSSNRFDFILSGVSWFDQHVLYMSPDPADPFAGLTTAIHNRFPEYPPYEGAFDTVIPHLTVAENATRWRMRRAATRLEAAPPICANASEVHLMAVSSTTHRWVTLEVFHLAETDKSVR